MVFHVIIPARYHSTRLPAKMLVDIAGKPMIQHVYERALQSSAQEVVIATDDDRIRATVEKFGAKVCMTDPQLPSGTDRIAEAVGLLNFPEEAIVVNVQGDLPLVPPTVIRQVAEDLANHADADMATLCVPLYKRDDLFNPNVVKVVLDKNGYALYFSRAPIPWDRDALITSQRSFFSDASFYHHIGLYAYRTRTIKRYRNMEPCFLEKIEALEQLRLLWLGGRIHVALAEESVPIEVNIEADLHFVRNILQNFEKKLTN